MAQTPINALVDEWLMDQHYSPLNTANLISILNLFTRWVEAERGVTDLRDVTKRQVRDWLDHREATVSPSTAHKSWQALSWFYGWLADDDEGPGEIDRSPVKGLKGCSVPINAEVRIAGEDDFARFVANTNRKRYEDRRMQALLAVLFYGGCRLSEALDANLGDLTIEGGTGTLYLGRTKTDEARTIFLPREAIGFLKRWLRDRIGGSDASSPLFVGSANTADRAGRLSTSAVTTWLMRYRERTGHDVPSPHAWRRGAAVRLVERGVDQMHVETQLGWKNDGKMIARYVRQERQRLSHDAIRLAFQPEGETEDRRDQRAKRRAGRRRLRAV